MKPLYKFEKFLCFLLLVMYSCSAATPRASTTLNALPQQADAAVVIRDTDVYVQEPMPSASALEDVRIPPMTVVDGVGIHGEAIASMRSGQLAPFPGVLFNGPALAHLEVEYRGLAQRCTIDRITELNRLRAQARADLDHVDTILLTERQITNILLTGRDREIVRLQTQLNNVNNPSIVPTVLMITGSAVVGAGVIGIIWGISSASRP